MNWSRLESDRLKTTVEGFQNTVRVVLSRANIYLECDCLTLNGE